VRQRRYARPAGRPVRSRANGKQAEVPFAPDPAKAVKKTITVTVP
jgi:hypothetical protein